MLTPTITMNPAQPSTWIYRNITYQELLVQFARLEVIDDTDKNCSFHILQRYNGTYKPYKKAKGFHNDYKSKFLPDILHNIDCPTNIGNNAKKYHKENITALPLLQNDKEQSYLPYRSLVQSLGYKYNWY
jgi:hypothetical protein